MHNLSKPEHVLTLVKHAKGNKEMTFSAAWPHGELEQIFPNIYFVTGTNITHYQDVELTHSRNMVIIKENQELTLINTIRLNEHGLSQLDKLGRVSNIVRIGAFHGRDDAFYVSHYNAKHWSIKGMDSQSPSNLELTSGGLMPLQNCSLVTFETSLHPEAVLHIAEHGGILITCDSIKNWSTDDPYFSQATKELYKELGFFGEASISSTWLEACQALPSDFAKILKLRFKHLLSAHGKPLLDDAYERVQLSIENTFKPATN